MVWHASLFQTRPANGLLQIVLQVLRFCRVREKKRRQSVAAAGGVYLLWSVTAGSGPHWQAHAPAAMLVAESSTFPFCCCPAQSDFALRSTE